MASDCKGKAIGVGDVVLLACEVCEVHEGGESDLLVRSMVPWDGKMLYNTFTLSGRQVEVRTSAPSRTVASAPAGASAPAPVKAPPKGRRR